MKVVSIVGAVLLSLLSASAFGQGQSLDQREAAIAARKAAIAEKQREARIAAEEAELDRQEAALAQGQTPQTAEQPAPAAEQAKPGWKQVKKVFSPIGRAIRNGSDKFQGQVEVTVTEVGNPIIRATTDDGVARYCSVDVLDRKVQANGTRAKVKKDSFAACSTAAPVTMASNATAPSNYVMMHGSTTQTTTASNGGTEVSVTLSRDGMIAVEKHGVRKQWKCLAPTTEDRRRPGTTVLVAWTAHWSAKDFTDRKCETYTGK